jgi:hypothetical protein
MFFICRQKQSLSEQTEEIGIKYLTDDEVQLINVLETAISNAKSVSQVEELKQCIGKIMLKVVQRKKNEIKANKISQLKLENYRLQRDVENYKYEYDAMKDKLEETLSKKVTWHCGKIVPDDEIDPN